MRNSCESSFDYPVYMSYIACDVVLQVQAMYFADPPQTPDLQFCKESLEMLMKYNDRYHSNSNTCK